MPFRMPENIEFWDFYWEQRLPAMENLGKREAILAASQLIRQMAVQRETHIKILEPGCGEGEIIGALLDAHAQLCDRRASAGIDFNPRSLAQARRSHPHPRWIEGDFTHPDLLAGLGQFDLVLLVNALHEVFSSAFSTELREVDVLEGKRRAGEALRNIVRCLAPGGRLVLFDGLEPQGDPEKRVTVRFREREFRDEFDTFAREYVPFRVTFTQLGSPLEISLSQRDLTRYLDKSIFIRKRLWQAERFESYQYFTEDEFRAAFQQVGLRIAELKTFTVNEDKWRHRLELVQPDVQFPQEHILILAQKE